MKKNFLLRDRLARKLYKSVQNLPIIDYHNHLKIEDITTDKHFSNITEIWITPDPYKHRAMRILGVEEKYITGDASDFEKFDKWISSLKNLLGNPLYDWSKMELYTVFGIKVKFNKVDSQKLYNLLNERLSTLSAKTILEKFNVEYSAPCSSVNDDITLFLNSNVFAPSLRGDDILCPTKKFTELLSKNTGVEITCLEDFIEAISARLTAFKAAGARYADHALDDGFSYFADDGENEKRFHSLLEKELCESDKNALASYILMRVAREYARHGFTLQLHIGAKRSTSDRLRSIAGPAGGYAAIGSAVSVDCLTRLLNDVEKGEFGLPRTLLFTLNPSDNEVMANLSGSYSKDGEEAIVTQGPAWWWCDHYKGMYDMLDSFSCHSVLSTFIGMTTDSRSLFSFVRHDYFRRTLANFISEKVKEGRMPKDKKALISLMKKLSYENAKKTLTI